jgi:DNA-binding transcriptional ArsR family regulator
MKRVFVFLLWASLGYSEWDEIKLIADYPNYYDYGSFNNAWTIACCDSVVHIVWEHRNTTFNSPGELYYTRSINGGKDFLPHQPLTQKNSHSPSITVEGEVVHVVWHDWRDGNSEIYYKRSVDGGVTWEDDVRLTEDDSVYSWYPSIAVEGGVVHVVWTDRRDGNWEVYYKRSVDGGVTWEDDVRLTEDDNAHSGGSSIGVEGEVVHVVWMDERDGNSEIYYLKSVDGGVTWEDDVRLTEDDNAYSEYPSIAVEGEVVHVVWEDLRDGNSEIYYLKSVDGGVTWEDDVRLTEDDNVGSTEPSIAVEGEVVHVVWTDYRDGNSEIYYLKSEDGGSSWGNEVKISDSDEKSWFSSITTCPCSNTNSSDVHIVWTEGVREKIYYRRHICEPTGVSEKEGEGRFSVICCEVGGEFLVYIPDKCEVDVEVYDIMGRKVDKESFNHPGGEYRFKWRQGHAGVYFFKFRVKNSKIGKIENIKKTVIF